MELTSDTSLENISALQKKMQPTVVNNNDMTYT